MKKKARDLKWTNIELFFFVSFTTRKYFFFFCIRNHRIYEVVKNILTNITFFIYWMWRQQNDSAEFSLFFSFFLNFVSFEKLFEIKISLI